MTKKVKKTKSKKETKLYMLECISIHKIRYCVETDQEGLNRIDDFTDWDSITPDLTEFSQEHVGEKIIAIQPIPDEAAYIKMFDKDNSYLSRWSDDKKKEFINKKFKK